jgi:hypothetical protein
MKTNQSFDKITDILDRIEIIKSDRGSNVIYNLSYKKGKCPRGYCRKIAELELEGEEKFVVTSEIYRKLDRGKGIGSYLYEYALLDNKIISTDYHSATKEAQYIWRKLIKKYSYKTNFFTSNLRVFVK